MKKKLLDLSKFKKAFICLKHKECKGCQYFDKENIKCNIHKEVKE